MQDPILCNNNFLSSSAFRLSGKTITKYTHRGASQSSSESYYKKPLRSCIVDISPSRFNTAQDDKIDTRERNVTFCLG